jgi:hypothetical protein
MQGDFERCWSDDVECLRKRAKGHLTFILLGSTAASSLRSLPLSSDR